MQKTVGRRDAQLVGMVFANLPQVEAVEVFGSVARDSRGKDLDMALTVDAVTYASYVLKLREATEYEDYYFGLCSERLAVACQVPKLAGPIWDWLSLATVGITLDLHLFPQGWKQHTDEIQTHFSHDDPAFVSNIAKDAVALRFVTTELGFVTTSW